MKHFAELYINDKKVFFEKTPDIFFTYAHTDLHNPTAIKNGFTKTLTIEGTPENNRIFNNFYDMKRINGGDLFNPSRKENFTLYRNGEIVETGYVKLDKVNRNAGKISYEVTLYGGLGQFLYNLHYKENGDPLKLSDLDYGVDLNMIINKETIKDAWDHINGVNRVIANAELYDFINFTPAYNGIPNDFTADKVAIDLNSFQLMSPRLYEQFVSTDGSFTTVNGWITADLAKEYDEWQTKDLRSYLQRPVVRFKKIVEACCNPKNNGGYEVDLDPEFFGEQSDYYQNAWMTLPIVREMESERDGALFEVSGDNIIIPTNTEGYVKLSMDVTLAATADTSTLVKTPEFLWTGIYRTNKGNITQQFNRAYTIQMVVYKANGEVVATSPCTAFYTDLGANGNTTNFKFDVEADANVTHITGQFNRQIDGRYVFNSQPHNISSNTFKYEAGMYGRLFIKTSTVVNEKLDSYDDGTLFNNYGIQPWDVKATISYNYNNETIDSKGELGYYLTKNKLFSTENTPCDYFLTYIKMFNLHIWKDKIKNKIYIRQRKNYFTGNIKDIDEFVNMGNNIVITPLTFETKWLELGNEVCETEVSENYKQDYGVNFGVQRIDTNYNFDTSVKNLIEKNAFKTTIQARGKTKYYINIHQLYEDDDVFYPPYMLDGIQPIFYKSDGDTAEGNYISTKSSQTSIGWWDEKYYDFLPKPLFTDKENKGVDGENVLLFYCGKVDTKDANGNSMMFQITDDIPEFAQLNEGEPCWIWSYDWDVVGKRLDYLPNFSRYMTNDYGWITKSWDFGTPRAIYVPDYSIDSTSSIYDQYWKPYLQDQYNQDTRKVECYVLLNNLSTEGWLRDFYYWEGTYWLLNKVIDYDVTSNKPTKCEFVRINNVNNYLS